MISVIISTFNRQEKLLKTLKEFEGQTLSRDLYEIIVVNDCSTDNTSYETVFGKDNSSLYQKYF